jgi:hypothetical protein
MPVPDRGEIAVSLETLIKADLMKLTEALDTAFQAGFNEGHKAGIEAEKSRNRVGVQDLMRLGIGGGGGGGTRTPQHE